VIAGLLLLLSGCVTLDWVVFNGIPCADVGPETCEDIAEEWDRICTPCEQEYDWARESDWMEGTLAPGETIRPIPPESVEQYTVASADGLAELDVYRILAHGDDPDHAAITVLYNHGNYASLDHYVPRVQMLHEAGYEVVTWDYRGYGKTLPAESPTPDQLMSDAIVVRDFVHDQLGREPSRVVPYGYSLGALSAVEQGLRRDGCALVLEAPFTSLDQIVAGNTATGFPAVFVSEGQFENRDKIAGYEGQLFVMSAGLDDLFPPEDVEVLVENAGGPTQWWLLSDAHHGVADKGIPEMGYAEYALRIDAFLDTTPCGGP